MAKWEVEEGVCSLIVTKDGVVISSSEDAEEIARKLNAFDEMLEAIKRASAFIAYIDRLHQAPPAPYGLESDIAEAIAKAEGN